LNVSTYIVPIRLALILTMSVSSFITEVILYLVCVTIKREIWKTIIKNAFVIQFMPINCCLLLHLVSIPLESSFYMPISRRGRIMWLGMAGGRPHRFPHNNFSSVYRIFTKLGHMILLWKGKNPIYFGVIRSKIKVTITINRIFDNRVVSTC